MNTFLWTLGIVKTQKATKAWDISSYPLIKPTIAVTISNFYQEIRLCHISEISYIHTYIHNSALQNQIDNVLFKSLCSMVHIPTKLHLHRCKQ